MYNLKDVMKTVPFSDIDNEVLASAHSPLPNALAFKLSFL